MTGPPRRGRRPGASAHDPVPVKVLHIEAGRHLYGGALQVLFLLKGLRRPGETHLLACPRDGAIAKAGEGLVDRLYAMRMGGDLDLALYFRLRRVMRRERPDLVHIHSRRGADLWGAVAARSLGIPAILSRRVDNPEPPWLVRLRYRWFERVITISQGIRQVLLAEGLSPEKVTCVRSAVDVQRYRPGCDRAWFRQAFSLNEGEPVVGMVAQFIPRKGHRDLLEAVPEILRVHPHTRVLLFGRGPLKEETRRQVAERGLNEHIRLCGFREDLHRILPCLDLVVHPAHLEGLGVSLLQAAACAVPMVATRIGGIPEVVRNGVNGILVEPGNHDELARAVNAVLSDPYRASQYGSVGRVMVEREFSIPAMVEGNRRVYEEVLAKK